MATRFLPLLAACASSGDKGRRGGDDTPDPDPLDADDDGDGWTENEGDCDDSDASAHPGGDEGQIADGGDDDCNGVADDRAVCPGSDGLYDTLQAAIDAAPDGFTLFVCPGSWAENLSIERPIRLESTGGAEVTTISGDGSAPVVSIAGAEGAGLVGFTLTGGRSAGDGGCLSVTESTVEISENIVSSCIAREWGGGIAVLDSVATVAGNRVSSCRAAHGGGIAVGWGEVVIEDNVVSENRSTSEELEVFAGNPGGGGGMLIVGDAALTGNTIESNRAAANGGGLYLVQGDGDLVGNTISGNVSAGDGGGAYLSFANGTFSGGVVSGNQAGDDAGGLRVYVGGMTVSDSTFSQNTAADDGGGMKLSHSANQISGCTFEENRAGDAGGGVELDNDDTFVTDSFFDTNSAARGGGLHSWANKAEFSVTDSTFWDNAASTCGGAIELDTDPHAVTLARLDIQRNRAPDGGGICVAEESVYALSNSLLVGNTAERSGGALHQSGGEGSLTNSVAVGNVGPEGTLALGATGTMIVNNGIIAYNDGSGLVTAGGAMTVTYSDAWDNTENYVGMADPTGTSGNISEEPMFVELARVNLQLQAESPCVDAGDPDILDTDGTRSDMGAWGGPEPME